MFLPQGKAWAEAAPKPGPQARYGTEVCPDHIRSPTLCFLGNMEGMSVARAGGPL